MSRLFIDGSGIIIMKYRHCILFNKVNKRQCKKYLYSFGQTKDIELIISDNGFSIIANLSKMYDKNEMLSGNSYLFPDAIKKALLIYLLTYSKNLTIKTITVGIDTLKEKISLGKGINAPVHSLIASGLVRELPEGLANDTIIQYILNTPKSKHDKRIASLFSFLCSKSKDSETERFIYLWTAFNGMYSWISEFIAKANNVDAYRRENKQIVGFLKFLELGEETILESDKSRIAKEVTALLKHIEPQNAYVELLEQMDLTNKIDTLLHKANGDKYNISPYGYVLTQLSYYYRCKLLHGSKPLYLFAFTDDSELHVLQIINNVLEEYIDKTLYLWFNDNFINNSC